MRDVVGDINDGTGKLTDLPQPKADMVNHPPHYNSGVFIELGPCDTYGQIQGFCRSTMQLDGKLYFDVEAIQVMRLLNDPRLFDAMKYLWRVGFGGKGNDAEDIGKAIFYLQDYLDNPVRVIAGNKRAPGAITNIEAVIT